MSTSGTQRHLSATLLALTLALLAVVLYRGIAINDYPSLPAILTRR